MELFREIHTDKQVGKEVELTWGHFKDHSGCTRIDGGLIITKGAYVAFLRQATPGAAVAPSRAQWLLRSVCIPRLASLTQTFRSLAVAASEERRVPKGQSEGIVEERVSFEAAESIAGPTACPRIVFQQTLAAEEHVEAIIFTGAIVVVAVVAEAAHVAFLRLAALGARVAAARFAPRRVLSGLRSGVVGAAVVGVGAVVERHAAVGGPALAGRHCTGHVVPGGRRRLGGQRKNPERRRRLRLRRDRERRQRRWSSARLLGRLLPLLPQLRWWLKRLHLARSAAVARRHHFVVVEVQKHFAHRGKQLRARASATVATTTATSSIANIPEARDAEVKAHGAYEWQLGRIELIVV